MSEELADANLYRERAEKLRATAAETNQRENREMLLQIAADYDRMANTLVAIARSKQVVDGLQNSN